MNMAEIWKKARVLKIDVKKLKKAELIRRIQVFEGNTACFATGVRNCPELSCCWREDCQAQG